MAEIMFIIWLQQIASGLKKILSVTSLSAPFLCKISNTGIKKAISPSNNAAAIRQEYW